MNRPASRWNGKCSYGPFWSRPWKICPIDGSQLHRLSSWCREDFSCDPPTCHGWGSQSYRADIARGLSCRIDVFTEPLSNKLEMIRRGNSKSFAHPELVKKAMNKEDRYSHLVPIVVDICHASAYLRHTIQTFVMKPDKNDCLVWDGTTTLLALDIVMNQVTPVNCEAPSLLAT